MPAEPGSRRRISAGGVVVGRDGRILVVNQNGDSWSLPKGHLEAGESELDAARREIAEESGVTRLSCLGELVRYERPRIARGGGEDLSEIKEIVLFHFETDQTELRPTDPAHPEARWVRPETALTMLTHTKDREVLGRILSRIRR
ncbi:MAG: hypothetical protein MOGMAGMI_01077 [Candidatus Omnitrophica bacterium]|nr:hypothetical protein [Candidatus Omnitrophota bacterium]